MLKPLRQGCAITRVSGSLPKDDRDGDSWLSLMPASNSCDRVCALALTNRYGSYPNRFPFEAVGIATNLSSLRPF